MTLFDVAAAFLLLVAAIGWLNARWLRLPTAVAMMLAGTLAAIVLLVIQAVFGLPTPLADALHGLQVLNFSETVLGYLLAFLLFAGAMQVSLSDLRQRWASVLSLATLGVVASTVMVGLGVWYAASLLGLSLPIWWALIFGALISPTDPIAVLAAVHGGGFSPRLQSILQGEALFNDGVGIVIFTALVAIAVGGNDLHPLSAIGHVGIEAIGGMLLGAVLGWVAVRAMRAIDEYAVEVSITLALAMGVYGLAQALHVSGPIAVVAAGLVIGDRGIATAMSDVTQRYVRGFWTLVDEILNALLFLMLGLELVVVGIEPRHAGLWLAAIVLVVAARVIVVAPWGAFFRLKRSEPGATTILAWGGLHGALSLALALTLPKSEFRELVLSITFATVLFSVVLQGLTFPWIAKRFSAAT